MRPPLLALLAFGLLSAAVCAGEQPRAAEYRFYGTWRSLAYRLPGAYRFLDRLDLTEEQQKALAKVYRGWMEESRKKRTEALKDLPLLSARDARDAAKRAAYYTRRAERIKQAQVPPPIRLVNDILSEEQLARIVEADKVIDAWNQWVARHMAKYDKKLDAVLGPPPKNPNGAKRYTYRVFESMLKGGSLLGRIGLTEKQEAALRDLLRQYYADYRQMLVPLSSSLAGLDLSYAQRSAISAAIRRKGVSVTRNQYKAAVLAILTGEQRAKLARATEIVAERDQAIWERYTRYRLELDAVLPPPAPVAKQQRTSGRDATNAPPR